MLSACSIYILLSIPCVSQVFDSICQLTANRTKGIVDTNEEELINFSAGYTAYAAMFPRLC